MRLAVELDQSTDGYGTVHRAGCRDLRDPEILGETDTRAGAAALLYDATGWEIDGPADVRFAPCARLA
jgi:hypothetical protein